MKAPTKSIIRAVSPWILNGVLAACFLAAVGERPMNANGEFAQPSCCVNSSGCAPVSCQWNDKVQGWSTTTPVADMECGGGTNSNSICGPGQGTQICGTWVSYTDSKCTIQALSGTETVPICSDNCSVTA